MITPLGPKTGGTDRDQPTRRSLSGRFQSASPMDPINIPISDKMLLLKLGPCDPPQGQRHISDIIVESKSTFPLRSSIVERIEKCDAHFVPLLRLKYASDILFFVEVILFMTMPSDHF